MLRSRAVKSLRLSALVLTLLPIQAMAGPEAAPIVLQAARMFDGTAEAIVDKAVIVVENASDALAAAESHGPNISLLLTDVTMPGMNGIELGREINRRHPEMKILYMSGYGSDQIAASDNINLLRKGGSGEEILQRVRQLLDEGEPTNTGTASDAGHD